MRKITFAFLALVLLCSHDMFLKLDSYFLSPNTEAAIQLFNGTFSKSENVIDRDRMIDASLVGNGSRTVVTTEQWSEKDSITILNFTTGNSGTWVAGVSTRPRNIEMDAEAFNRYLAHDGIVDMLDWRKANDAMDKDAVEKYSKHVKTIFQVGDKKTDDWETELGYPIEFVPLSNPYDLNPGDELKVKLLRDGQPLAGELVYVDSEKRGHDHAGDHEHGADTHSHDDAAHDHDHADDAHSHDHDAAHSHDHDHETKKEEDPHHHASALQFRTDANGVFSFPATHAGIWQLRTIQLVAAEEDGLTHESNWATLTFEVADGHSHDSADHAHDHGDGAHTHGDGEGEHTHEHEDGFPTYAFLFGSLLLIGGLFFWFNRKK